MLHLELLTKINQEMIKTANANGINLQDHFKTQDEFKNFVIAFTFKQLIDNFNMTVEEATDAVLGENAYEQIYELCQA